MNEASVPSSAGARLSMRRVTLGRYPVDAVPARQAALSCSSLCLEPVHVSEKVMGCCGLWATRSGGFLSDCFSRTI